MQLNSTLLFLNVGWSYPDNMVGTISACIHLSWTQSVLHAAHKSVHLELKQQKCNRRRRQWKRQWQIARHCRFGDMFYAVSPYILQVYCQRTCWLIVLSFLVLSTKQNSSTNKLKAWKLPPLVVEWDLLWSVNWTHFSACILGRGQ